MRPGLSQSTHQDTFDELAESWGEPRGTLTPLCSLCSVVCSARPKCPSIHSPTTRASGSNESQFSAYKVAPTARPERPPTRPSLSAERRVGTGGREHASPRLALTATAHFAAPCRAPEGAPHPLECTFGAAHAAHGPIAVSSSAWHASRATARHPARRPDSRDGTIGTDSPARGRGAREENEKPPRASSRVPISDML